MDIHQRTANRPEQTLLVVRRFDLDHYPTIRSRLTLASAPEVDFSPRHPLAATSKAVLTYVVGKRDAENTRALVRDLRARVLNRPQITADGFPAYPPAIDSAFENDVDFAQLVKLYQSDGGGEDAAHRYSPGRRRGIEKTVIRGMPNPDKISTSYVERFNLSSDGDAPFYAANKRFQQEAWNHRGAISLWIGYYNLCRVHETLPMTPAMALGVTDHIWSIAELVEKALSTPGTPKPTPPAPRDTLQGRMPFRPYVIRGGKLRKPRQ